MKNQLSLLLVLMFAIVMTSEAQEVQKKIEKGFLEMQSAIIKKDFNKSVDYIADELFTVIPKSQMVSILQSTFSNPQMEIVLRMPENIAVSAPEKEGEKFYAILSFPNIQKIRLLEASGLPMNKDNESVKQMKSTFESAVGTDNVAFDDETGFFTVTVDQKTVAISDDGKDGWKYLNFDKSQAAILGPLLPASILEKLQ